MREASRSILVLGAGMFGLTGALELRRRGWRVTVVEPGTVPRAEAASTDISKVVRADYGADDLYTRLGIAALAGWKRWNAAWGEHLYHADGFLVMSREALRPGGFEWESHHCLNQRGFALERLDSDAIAARFSAWTAGRYQEGYLNPRGGWAESGRVVARLATEARVAGVEIRERTGCRHLLESGSRVTGMITDSGESLRAELVLVAAGAWTPFVLPELARVLRATGQPVVCFQARDRARFSPPRFPVWAADIGRTGWYGFPALADGTVKIANHGPGRPVHPDEPRTVLPAEVDRFREFVAANLPELVDAPVSGTRLCLYCDSFDGNFWIDHHPARPGLVVAAGDSGHAFKFAPIMGALIADAVERQGNRDLERFRWREPQPKSATDGARCTA